MRLSTRDVVLLLLLLFVFFNEPFKITASQPHTVEKRKLNINQDHKNKIEENIVKRNDVDDEEHLMAEMAIIADPTFSARFDHDTLKMLQYLQAVFVDVDTRFRTLPGIRLSFRLNLFSAFEGMKPEQLGPGYFVVYSSERNGHVDIPSTLIKFRRFMHDIHHDFAKFDIAMGLLVAQVDNDITASTIHEGACQIDNKCKIIPSSFVVSLYGSDNVAVLVTRQIARLFGATYDNDEECLDEPNHSTQKYIMSRDFNPLSTHFSLCSIKKMTKFLMSKKADCLRRLDLEDSHKPYFNTSSSERIQISDDSLATGVLLDQQCQLIRKGSDHRCTILDSSYHDNVKPCGYSTRCSSGSMCNLNPLDATPCGNDLQRSWCFRGDCVPVGVKLQNRQTEECVTSTNSYDNSEVAKMGNCDKLSSPLDLITIRNMGPKLGKFLVMRQALPGRTEDGQKCLRLGTMMNIKEGEYSLVFANCPNELGAEKNIKLFGWDITLHEFGYLVSHYHFRNVCLRARETRPGELSAAYCAGLSEFDEQALWLIRSEGGVLFRDLMQFMEAGEEQKGTLEVENHIFHEEKVTQMM